MTAAQRWLLHAAFALAALTGLAVAVFKYFVTSDDPYSAVGSPWLPWSLGAHVVLTPLLVFTFGWVFTEHVLQKLKNGHAGRASGIATLVLLPASIVSGYLIQTTTGERTHALAVGCHLGTGAAVAVAWIVHLVRSRVTAARPGAGWTLVRRARAAGL